MTKLASCSAPGGVCVRADYRGLRSIFQLDDVGKGSQGTVEAATRTVYLVIVGRRIWVILTKFGGLTLGARALSILPTVF